MKKTNHYLERASYAWSEDSIRLIITPSATAKSIYFYIQEAGYFKTNSSYFTERQNLNSFLIVYTISGKGTLRYEEKEYTLTSGQCFYINCMNHHFYETLNNESWEFLWIHFNGSNALGYYEEFIKNDFNVLTIQNPDFIETSLRKIISVNQKKNFSTEIISSGLIVGILTELLVQNSTASAATIFIPDYIKRILKEIDKNFKEELSLNYLSEKNGISKYHLSREFKKYTGTTVNEYIINSRISYAKELLKYSDLSVNEIAYESGIHNVSHFINLFKSRENSTPLAYRREWQI